MKRRLFPSQKRGRHGMVLLEVVVALGIFILVAFALIKVLDTAMAAAKARNEMEAAMLGLQNQLALIHAARVAPVDEDLPDDGSGIAYHLQIEPEQMQDQKGQLVAGMYRATVTAKWKSDAQNEDRRVSELLYQP